MHRPIAILALLAALCAGGDALGLSVTNRRTAGPAQQSYVRIGAERARSDTAPGRSEGNSKSQLRYADSDLQSRRNVIRLSIHQVISEGSSAKRFDRDTRDALLWAQYLCADHLKSAGLRPDDQRRDLNGLYTGSNIAFRIAHADQIVAPRDLARSGRAVDYALIANLRSDPDCINVYVVERVADEQGSHSGVCARHLLGVFIDGGPPQILEPAEAVNLTRLERELARAKATAVHRAWTTQTLAHELGHFLGLPHADRGIMAGPEAPRVRLPDSPVPGGVFTLSQIRKMLATLPAFALEQK